MPRRWKTFLRKADPREATYRPASGVSYDVCEQHPPDRRCLQPRSSWSHCQRRCSVMTTDKLLLLQEEMADFQSAANHLRYSLERLEALASRFAQLSNLLTQRNMRLIDGLELAPANTLLDRIYRAEKRGWIDSGSVAGIACRISSASRKKVASYDWHCVNRRVERSHHRDER